ncbi:3-ketoacyl-ACP reductase [Candidatus Wolfebacteria bacterium CG10_big_fil_rev_8_21_14_0_10_31_9]|uniref:3-ketoacyl-ACP reductase n=1 Tax=Candidatus Wolfebacteria bacterium CG10_big_fil_rev_8_21_14_0_10_31_9 TaxID=1975070 RepID=A0A2H0RCG3_9BACT|nr:MAG: 3-ketoacyl-ACP reductase [Candidatus Wolfebacteria bacterium CG10_big_fil_rev_8_21_14_0_10_31_9]
MEVKNKTIFITGGADGIGLATVKKLLAEGANVIIYSKSVEKLNDLSLDVGKTLIIKGDVTDRENVKKAMQGGIKKFGEIDILINNAGVARNEKFLETTEKDWDFIINVNIKGVFICMQEFIKEMRNEKLDMNGKMIINIASGAGEYGGGEIAVYSATKAGVINITQGLNEELKNLGIKWVTVCPGATDTKMFANLFPEEKPYHTTEQVAEVIYKTITEEIKPDNRLIVDVFHHMR